MSRGIARKTPIQSEAAALSARWASAGFAGVCWFAVSVALMHGIQPDLSPTDDAVSYYMNGPLGWILGLGLVGLGLGSLCLVVAIRRMSGAARSRFGWWCLAAWGVGATIGGVFPPDPRGHWGEPPSIPGMIHANVAMIAFLAFPLAAIRLSSSLGQASGSRGIRAWLRGLALGSAATLVVFFVCLAPVFSGRAPYALGLVERVLLAAYIAWLGTASLGMRRAALRI